jgi:hypothetical protein
VKWYYWLGVVAAALGAMTLVPAPASKPCLLGYYARCPFAPAIAAVVWVRGKAGSGPPH